MIDVESAVEMKDAVKKVAPEGLPFPGSIKAAVADAPAEIPAETPAETAPEAVTDGE